MPRIHCSHQQHRLCIHCLWRAGVLYSQPDIDLCDHPDQLHSHHHSYAHARCPYYHQDYRNFYCFGSHIYDLHFRVHFKQHNVSSILDLLGDFLLLCHQNRVAVIIHPRDKNKCMPTAWKKPPDIRTEASNIPAPSTPDPTHHLRSGRHVFRPRAQRLSTATAPRPSLPLRQSSMSPTTPCTHLESQRSG